MDVASQSTVCEWHQLQGLNEVIYSQYRQNFRACGGLRGNLITPSRTRPPVGARLVVPTHCLGVILGACANVNVDKAPSAQDGTSLGRGEEGKTTLVGKRESDEELA
jgi:hypothetical protein